MSERDGFEPGVPCWVDTWQPDAGAAVAFYTRLFGWEADDSPVPDADVRHVMLRLRDREVAAVGSRPRGDGPALDPAWGTLMEDLRARGLIDSTLIVWHGEFGRLPISERMDGRDHNANGFSVWLAGGGVKGGTVVGATDEYGYRAVENKKTIYELHATILHLLGLDYEKLTYRFNGRDMRLTDVHGRLIQEII